ncbi:MAG: pseudouridine synthase [Bacillota bacterium]|nr:pseudouridine synthase [Bacillota bacterium]
MERLDKVLSNLGYGTRKEVKAIIKNGEVLVDAIEARDNGMLINPETSVIKIFGEEIKFRKNIYLMMNKPDGVISATFDDYDETVIDLLEEEHKVFNPFPVGRLDKDTVGLLFITNDGELNHRLISPKYHVDKVYFARIDKKVCEEDIIAFNNGIVLDDGYKCMPGKLEIVKSDENGSEVYITIHEGKFHQVKRMFESLNKNVIYLKRVKFGKICLDIKLSEGEYRELSKEELKILCQI